MRLKTQFIITMLLFGIILAVIAASAIITNQQVEKAGQQERIAAHIAQGASELSYLANDYLIYRESQQLKRWQSRFAAFSAEVAALRMTDPSSRPSSPIYRRTKTGSKRYSTARPLLWKVPPGIFVPPLTRRFFRSPGAGWRSNPRGWQRMLHGCHVITSTDGRTNR